MAILSTDELLLQRCMSPNLALRVIWVPRNYCGAFRSEADINLGEGHKTGFMSTRPSLTAS